FLVPHGLQRARGYFRHQAQHVWAAEGAEATRVVQGGIGISGVEWRAPAMIPVALARDSEHAQEDEASLVVSLVERIHVRPFTQVAQVADIPRSRVHL